MSLPYSTFQARVGIFDGLAQRHNKSFNKMYLNTVCNYSPCSVYNVVAESPSRSVQFPATTACTNFVDLSSTRPQTPPSRWSTPRWNLWCIST